jgi:hypothetical protein
MHPNLSTPLPGHGRSLKPLCAVALVALALTNGFVASPAWAAVPQTLNYQGFLTNKTTSAPLSATASVTFKLYDALTAGTLLYTEIQPTVVVTNGVFNAQIGSVTPLSLAFDKPYWLEITIGTDTLAPRQPLASSATALRASNGTNSITGSFNLGVGLGALGANTTGSMNSAFGINALASNTTGGTNTASGVSALNANSTGNYNVASGAASLALNTTGSNNAANGMRTLGANTTGDNNTAAGFLALSNNTVGANNIAIGANGGASLTTGNFNIDIGNVGVAGEGNTIRIGDTNQTRAFVSGIRAVTTGNNDAQPVVIDSAGQLGSLTCTAGQLFQFNGTKWVCSAGFNIIPGTGGNNSATGTSALQANTTGFNNTAIGVASLQANTTGSYNVASGYQALFSNTTGYNNTVTGAQALYTNTTGYFNTVNGAQTLFANTTGSSNTANGMQALFTNTVGNDNTATGMQTLYSNLTGSSNTAAGSIALRSNTIGNNNTATGFSALYSNLTGTSNTAAGSSALRANTIGSFNTGIGANSLLANTTGINNSGLGVNALLDNTTGAHNSAIGTSALTYNVVGSFNTALGDSALFNATGSNNIGIGYAGGTSLTTGNYNIDIGSVGVAAEGNTIRIGDTNQTRAFISGIRAVTTGINDAQPVGIDSAGQLGSLTCMAGQVMQFNGTQWVCVTGFDVVPGTGTNNTAVGLSVLNSNTTGYNNTAVGVQAMSTNATGLGNSAFGYQALQAITTGSLNTAIGEVAGNSIASGNLNTVVGYNALAGNPTGSGNIAIGANSAWQYVGGDNNIFIGYESAANGAVGFIGSGLIYIGDPAKHHSGATFSTYINAQNFFAVSDRNEKQDFSNVDALEVLRKVASLPTQGWSYKSDQTHARHIGPMAQDFFATFGLGMDNKHISLVDEGGIALTAIQGLNQKLESVVKAQADRIAELEKESAKVAQLGQDRTRQAARIAELEVQTARIAALEQQSAELQRTVKLLLARDRLNETVALQH